MLSSKKSVNLTALPEFSNCVKAKKWKILETEVVSILNSLKLNKSLEELYRTVEDLHSINYLPLLYNLQMVIETHLSEKLECLLVQDNILEAIDKLWREFYLQIVTIKNIFLCIDRSSKKFKYNTVQSISLNLFTNIIIMNPAIKIKLITTLMEEIDNERNGNQTDIKLLKSVVEMLNYLQIYIEIFQVDFLKNSQKFYKSEADNLIKTLKIPFYLQYVNKRITEEKTRIKNYLNEKSELQITDIVLKEFIEKHLEEILNSGFDELIENKMLDELEFIYNFSQRIQQGTKFLLTYFRNFITKKGVILTDLNNEKNMIQQLLDFRDNLDEVIEKSFKNRDNFHESLRGAFESFINNSTSKIAQLLAKHVDNKLRSKEINDDELENVLNKIIKLFKFIRGKDVFGAFYKKYLSTRLLLGKSASQDAEHSMILKLKHECGSGFTSNLEGMFQDINLSKTINSTFKQRLNVKNLNGDLSVNILTSSYWPNYPNFNLNLPMELVNYQEIFQKFYLSNHSGRKLLWQPSLGHCIVRGQFDCGIKELQVSLFQTVVLLLFNNSPELTFKDIEETTNLTTNELKRTLISLAFGKNRILMKQPKTKDINNDDVFVINTKFIDKLFRVKINQIQLQDTIEDEKETERNVMVDRQFQIDAAIVRIMKNKKTIKHNQLMWELYNILDIPVNKTDLKKRIELLIEREYMERDKDNDSSYVYIA